MQMRCHYWIFITCNNRETINSFARGPYVSSFNWYVFILLTKMRTETKTVPSTWYIFNFQECTHTDFLVCALYCIGLHEGSANFHREKRSVVFVTGHLFIYLMILSHDFISHLFGDYANIDMWISDCMKAWNSVKNDCGRFVENQMQWPLY